MNDTVEFFKELNKLDSFDIKLNDVTSKNFRIMMNDHVFPDFELNKHFGLNCMMTKIDTKKINEKRLIRTINNLKESTLYDKSDSGLIFFGVFKDKNDELYACLSSQLDQNDLIKFYYSQALEETLSNLEVRYDLIQKGFDPSITPKTLLVVQTEYDELRKCKLNYLYANRYNYLKTLENETQLILKENLYLLNEICNHGGLKTIGEILTLDHVTYKKDFLYYFVTELHNRSLVFYNLQEGFGLIENTNDTAFLIPTVSFSNENLESELNIENVSVYESSVLSRKNYNSKRFLSREDVLHNIKDYAKTQKITDLGVREINQFKPQFLYLI